MHIGGSSPSRDTRLLPFSAASPQREVLLRTGAGFVSPAPLVFDSVHVVYRCHRTPTHGRQNYLD